MRLDARVGTRIGEYEIEHVIGRGATGVVYLAEHVRLKRKVALKLFGPEPARDDPFRRRFTVEWERLAELDHPNIIPIFEADEVGGVPYIAMKYVRGESLADEIEREGTLDPERALDVLGQVATALDFAHERGVFHGAVKPHNILIASEADPAEANRAFLSDFAIIKDPAASLGITSPAQTVRTRGYMAPEQFRGDPVDARTDVYALGCVLFETLTGSPPFASEEADPLTFAHFEKPPPSVHERRPDLPLAIDAVLEKALAKQREGRFETPTELLTSARESLAGRPLQLPGAGASAIPDDLAAVSSPNGLSMPTVDAAPRSASADTAPTVPAPIDRTVPVLTLPAVLPPAPVDERVAGGGASPEPAPPSDARASRRRLLLVAALVAVLALVGGVAIALSGGEDGEIRAGAPTTTGPVDTGPAPSGPVETGPTGTTSVEPIGPVGAPLNVEVASASAELVHIEWEVSTAGSSPVRFLVLRNDERVASVTEQSFRDTDVAPGQRHEYRVVAVGEDGSRARSTLVVVNVPVSQVPDDQPATDGGGGAPPPPPPDQCDGIIIGDDCIQD
jgi:serine/threonine-protein kinase